MKKLFLYITTISNHKNRLGKLIYSDNNVLIFNDKSYKYNYVFTLDSSIALYYALNHKICDSVLFLNEIYEHQDLPKKVETFSIFDKKQQQTTVQVSKNQVTLYGFRISRIRNIRETSNVVNMIIEPFSLYKKHFKKKKQFVSLYGLIDGLLEINKKFFKSNKGQTLRKQLEMYEDIFDDDRVLVLDDVGRWKLSQTGVDFCISPVLGIEEIKPEKPNEWLQKVVQTI